jgi:hypothetical protein
MGWWAPFETPVPLYWVQYKAPVGRAPKRRRGPAPRSAARVEMDGDQSYSTYTEDVVRDLPGFKEMGLMKPN